MAGMGFFGHTPGTPLVDAPPGYVGGAMAMGL
jgi:hypothetical protein